MAKRRGITARPSRGFTLIEMMITLAVFILLAASVFGIMTGVLQSTSTLQDNQNHHDQVNALNAFLKKKLDGMPAGGTLVSYLRGDGQGLLQNGVLFGTPAMATVIDAQKQANGYYALRLTSLAATIIQGQRTDARQLLQQAVMADDPTLTWRPLLTDLKTLSWKFQGLNVTQWVDLWSGSGNPNLVEFSMQPAGDLRPTTMDFWIPQIVPLTLDLPAPTVNAP